MKRLKEIEARLAEIRAMLRGEGEVDLDALEKEVADLEAERAALIRRQEIANRAADGLMPGLRTVEGAPAGGAQGGEQRAEGLSEPAEYRDAWAAAMLGRPLTAEQRSVYERTNAEYRAYTHTTENTAVLIPNTVVAGIWKRAEEGYPLWADVQKFHVRGTLTMKKHTGITDGDAAWYDEDTPVADEQNAFGEINLTGCELAKSVTVSWKLRAMAVPEFIAFIEREIGERMGAALGANVYRGKGKPGQGDTFKPEPYGIKTVLLAETNTPQVVTYAAADGIALADLRAAVAKLHSSYIKRACWYANSNTVWVDLAAIEDGMGRSIFIADQATQGAVGRMLGMEVKTDAGIADGEVLIGAAYDGYVANINEDMTMHTEEHVKPRNTDYMGYAIVDGDVLDNQAFAVVKKST